MSVQQTKNRYKVLFRNSTVVEERIIAAKTMVKAAKIAGEMTASDAEFPGWSVYSITLC